MSDVQIRIEGTTGRITLTRPQALNALSYQMCLDMDAALIAWQDDPAVTQVLIDAEGPRAFCAGGDIAEIYQRGMACDYDYGRRFWCDEYQMNARIAEFPKPVISLMQGFVMGGGVGLGGHASHRIVAETAQVSMPECGIGLVPDVGGTEILARAPGQLGKYLGTTGYRMGPADAIFAGFADHFIPQADWPALVAALVAAGGPAPIADFGTPPPEGRLSALRPLIDRLFAAGTAVEILKDLAADSSDFAAETLKILNRASPLSVALTIEMQNRQRANPGVRAALAMEYRVNFRIQEHGDILEGTRAAVIDKDRTPRWKHGAHALVRADEVAFMLAPLGADELQFGKETS
jgi:enoyl-CoA hydratase